MDHGTCRVCGSEEGSVHYPRESMTGSWEAFAYFECSVCGLLQILRYPDDMSTFYAEGYYSHSPKRSTILGRMVDGLKGVRDAAEASRAHHPLAITLKLLAPSLGIRRTYEILGAYLDRADSILDVGSGGSGSFLRLAARFNIPTLHGIDPFLKYETIEIGPILLEKKSVFQVAREYSVVIFNHSLEHMPNQIETLRAAYNATAPGGYCIVRVPCKDSMAWQQYGINWAQLDPPRHFYLHTLQSIDIVADKCGFNVVEIGWDSYGFQFWGSEQISNGVALNDSSSLLNAGFFESRRVKRASERKAFQANSDQQGDQVVVVLRRPSN